MAEGRMLDGGIGALAREPLSGAWAALDLPFLDVEDALTVRRSCPSFRLAAQASGEWLAAWGEEAWLDDVAGSAPFTRPFKAVPVLDWIPDPPAGAPGPWLCALAFDPSRPLGPSWSGFSAARFVVPRLLLWSRAGRTSLAAFAGPGEARLARARLAEALGDVDGPRPPIVSRWGRVRARGPAAAARDHWDALVREALSAIERRELSKIVLARAFELFLSGVVDPLLLARRLAERFPGCRSFLVRGRGGAFVGATPERFCSLVGSELFADALAGTSRPGQGALLLDQDKELREHRWVVEHLARGLGPLSTCVDHPPRPQVRALANVDHLYTPVRAHLLPGIGLDEVVHALHPTPAVGGVPPAAALRFLRSREGLERGLYAGLVGYAGEDHAELFVAIRSALLRERSVRVFVGAGIVSGSTLEGEWDETQLKARALLDVLEDG